MPLCKEKPYYHPKRKLEYAKNLPAFAADAAGQIAVTEAVGKNRRGADVPQVTVIFPAALSGGQTFDYEVQAELKYYDVTRVFGTMRVFADNYYRAWDMQEKTVKCVFTQAELPKKVNLTFAITPLDAFGNRGKTIYSKNFKLGEAPAAPAK